MKVISTIVAALIALGAVAANADKLTEHAERRLILGGGEVPIGTKAYTVGIRSTADGNTFCGGALISPIHVLTTAACTGFKDKEAGFVSVGTHYINGTKDGEQIKVVSAQNHTEFNASSISYNFAVLTLEKASKFQPITLPAADDSDIVPGMWSKVMGWGQTTFPKGNTSYELRAVDLEVWDNKNCSLQFAVDNSSVCAGGAAGKDSCTGDYGGPLVKEKAQAQGDEDDVLIGLVSWGNRCGRDGEPAVYSRVSSAIEWLSNVT